MSEWLQSGKMVYELIQGAWENGAPRMENKWWVSVSSVHLSQEECEKIAMLISRAPQLVEALHKIVAIEDKVDGGDWDEIEDARRIAREALIGTDGEA